MCFFFRGSSDSMACWFKFNLMILMASGSKKYCLKTCLTWMNHLRRSFCRNHAGYHSPIFHRRMNYLSKSFYLILDVHLDQIVLHRCYRLPICKLLIPVSCHWRILPHIDWKAKLKKISIYLCHFSIHFWSHLCIFIHV